MNIAAIEDIAKKCGYAIVHFGSSRSNNDVDVAIFQACPASLPFATHAISLFQRWYSELDVSNLPIISRLAHRPLLKRSSKYYHLIFYPSVAFFKLWESPEFTETFSTEAKWIHGIGPNNFRNALTEAEKSSKQNAISQYGKYVDILCANMTYAALKCRHYPRWAIADNYTYIAKFSSRLKLSAISGTYIGSSSAEIKKLLRINFGECPMLEALSLSKRRIYPPSYILELGCKLMLQLEQFVG